MNLQQKLEFRQEDQILGFHGTSMEALEHALKTGVLPSSASSVDDESQHEGGRLFFYPTIATVHNLHFSASMQETLEDAANGAKNYAGSIGYIHGFLSALGIRLDDRRFTERTPPSFKRKDHPGLDIEMLSNTDSVIDRLKGDEYNDTFRALKKRKKTTSEIARAIRIGVTRSGVRLGILKNIFPRYQVIEGDENEGDAAIVCPEGLPIEYIGSIELFGHYERSKMIQLLKDERKGLFQIS